MASGMNADLLAKELLDSIGGQVNDYRNEAFRRFAQALINHIRANMVVTSTTIAGQIISQTIR